VWVTLTEHKRIILAECRGWEEYREALVAHPDAIELPLKHLDAGHTFVAEHGKQILGFCVVLPRPDGDADLDGLFVEPAFWKHGTGRRLVQEAEGLAASRGAKWLYVIGNPKAQGFYEGCNFEHMAIEQTRFGPGLSIRKRLSADSPDP
jgi:GNAT superfamily N-acetyltransferase